MIAAPYAQVDAFTNVSGRGNRAAVLILQSWPDDGVLQAIAAETALPATSFVVREEPGWQVRWFSPVAELAMCGHGTLAAGHIVSGGGRVQFSTQLAGVLDVVPDGSGYVLSLPAVPTEPGAKAEAASIFPAGEAWHHPDGYVVFLYASADEVVALAPDWDALGATESIQFICTAPGAGHPSGADVVSRVFVGGKGAGEDAATGSAHAVLAPIWAARLGRPAFTAHQASARGADLGCRLAGDRVLISGNCVTVMEGTYRLPVR